jgi:hypothetical protein
MRYRIVGSTIKLVPVPDNNLEIRLWYIPRSVKLTLDTDIFNDINGWSEYIIIDCAIKMLSKEESDVSVLINEKLLMKRRIEEASNNRDTDRSESIQDIYIENYDYLFGGGKGSN